MNMTIRLSYVAICHMKIVSICNLQEFVVNNPAIDFNFPAVFRCG